MTTRPINSSDVTGALGYTPAPLSAGIIPPQYTNGHQKGTATNDNAAAGEIGEIISSNVFASPVALTPNVPANMTSIVLTPGDWDVELIPTFTGGATTLVLYLAMSISLVSATLDQTNGRTINIPTFSAAIFNSVASALVAPGSVTVRMSVAVNTTIYAVAQSFFSVSTCSALGLLRARRVR